MRGWRNNGQLTSCSVAAGLLTCVVLGLAACTSSPDGPVAPVAPATTSSASPRPTSAAPRTPLAPTTTAAPVPTVPADVPTTGKSLLTPTEQPPIMPVTATAHTPAGAQAFAVFFVKTIDWGFATESSAYMRHYYQPTCATCNVYANNFGPPAVSVLCLIMLRARVGLGIVRRG